MCSLSGMRAASTNRCCEWTPPSRTVAHERVRLPRSAPHRQDPRSPLVPEAHGNAAVLVGTGLSLNAKPLTPGESALVRGLAVLLPRVPVGDSRAAALGEMLDGMSGWGFAFEAIYPYLARITPESLASLDRKHAPAAVEAVLVWLREGERLQIGPPPADLPREIAVTIGTRRPSNPWKPRSGSLPMLLQSQSRFSCALSRRGLSIC
jgi:hypothetical protein